MKNKLFDPAIFTQSWMMGEADLDALISAAQTLTGDELAAILLKTKTGDKTPPPYTVKDGVAVIHIRGTLTKESYYWSYYSNNTTIRTFADLLNAAALADADPAVDKKVLDIDCNGSTVAGCFETMSVLKKSAKIKPFYTYANSNMKSGGMLIGSVGRQIAAPKTAEIGSIGVRTVHYDESKLNDRIGINVTHLAAGKYKTMGNPDEPLSKEAKEYFQDHLDTTYTLFVDAIAENRKMKTDKVLAAAEGAVFLGEQAKENGLIDLIVDDLDSFISLITKEDTSMDSKEFKTAHPALYSELEEKFMAAGRTAAEDEAETRLAEAVSAGQAAVIGMITALAGQEIGDNVKKMIDAGLTVDQLSAVQGIIAPQAPAAETGKGGEISASQVAGQVARQDILNGLQASGNQAVDGGNLPSASGPESFESAMSSIQTEEKCTRGQALMKAAKLYPELHDKYIQAANKGKKSVAA